MKIQKTRSVKEYNSSFEAPHDKIMKYVIVHCCAIALLLLVWK
jgi:phage gp36-like protein